MTQTKKKMLSMWKRVYKSHKVHYNDYVGKICKTPRGKRQKCQHVCQLSLSLPHFHTHMYPPTPTHTHTYTAQTSLTSSSEFINTFHLHARNHRNWIIINSHNLNLKESYLCYYYYIHKLSCLLAVCTLANMLTFMTILIYVQMNLSISICPALNSHFSLKSQ